MTTKMPEQPPAAAGLAPICVARVGDRTNPDGGPCLRCKGTGADPDPLAPAGVDEARQTRAVVAAYRVGVEVGERLAAMRARLADLAEAPPPARRRHLEVVKL
jgi:hypothetical protein